MSFFDKLSANVTNAGRIGSQKLKNMSEASSLKSEQNVEKRHIQDAMNEIARLYLEKYKDDPNAEFAEQIASIKTAEKRIAELEAQIEAVRAREPELVPVPEEPAQPRKAPTAMVCMQCGHSYPAGEYACKNCGSQLIPQYGNPQNPAAATETPINAAPVQPVMNGVPAPSAEPAKPVETSIPEQSSDNAIPAQSADVPAQPESPAAPADSLGTDQILSQNTSRFCAYCGKSCETGQAFCANCGKKL